MRRTTRKVTWTAQNHKKPELSPHPFIPEMKLPSEYIDTYMVHLIPGSLWTTSCDLFLEFRFETLGYYKQHELRYVTNDLNKIRYAKAPDFPKGTIAIYSEQVRVEEGTTTGSIIRIPRHTFIINGIRYMTVNLTDFTPVL